MAQRGYALNLELVPYREAWQLQQTLADDVGSGALPDTVLLLEHPPVVTLGRRTDPGELHIPPEAAVEIVEIQSPPQDAPAAEAAPLSVVPKTAHRFFKALGGGEND